MKNKDAVPVLTHQAKEVHFPLTKEDKEDIQTLKKKFEQEDPLPAGLAAVQIGIAKRIIIFEADDPEIKKFRSDFTQMMPRTIWINPSYEGVAEEGYEKDWEACYSVKDVAGLVKRFKKIRYKAYDQNGKAIEGTAEGFLARLIQHEIDHLNGVLFTDIAEKVMSRDEYRKMREEQKAS